MVFLGIVLLYSIPYKTYGDNDFRIIETSPDGLVIVFQTPEIKFSQKEYENQTFQTVSFNGCSFTHEIGKAQVPIRVVTIGIPDESNPTLSIQNTQYKLLNGYKLYPVEEQIIKQLPDASHVSESKFVIDRGFYSESKFYPRDIGKIEPVGYLRQQRLARIVFHPVQYNPATSQLKIYTKMEIRINFSSSKGNSYQKLGINNKKDAFEGLYENILLNYEQAKELRKPRTRIMGMSPSPQAGNKYKIAINKNGIYRLSYEYLMSMGIEPSAIDPKKIEIESAGTNIPIYVEGYEDGKLDPGDFIEFYGVKMDSKYTEENIYWLSWGSLGTTGTKSWMMALKDGTPKTPGLKPPVSFFHKEHLEKNFIYDPLKKETSETADHFFWSALRGQDTKRNQIAPFAINLPYRTSGAIVNSSFKLNVNFQGLTFARGASNHKVKIQLNNTEFLAQWEGATEFLAEFTASQWLLNRTNWLSMTCEDNNGTSDETDPKWDLYLNWIQFEYWRDFVAEENSLEFSTVTFPSVSRTSAFSIKNFNSPDIVIYQIVGSNAVARITNQMVERDGNNYSVTFEDDITQPTKYVVTAASATLRPVSLVKDQPSTLYDPANRADYIMITHKDFRKSTERLAEFRRKRGLDVVVVDVEDIYDEFSYGIFDPKAIKRFLKYAYFNWEKIPTYVLLMGDAHWDYKYVFHEQYLKYENYPRIYVPTYHGYNAPYGETAMDHRFVTVSGDDIIPDIFIGRIPAEKLEEADVVVDKIIAYEEDPYRGIWQSRIMLIADDEKSKSGDEIFEESRVELASDYIPMGYEVAEVYLRRIGEPYLVRKMINMEINSTDRGVVMLEYAGHGGAHSWAHEYIFSWEDVKKLQNHRKYPFVITTTCENGYFDNPTGGNKSIIELFLLQPKGGAIACLSATRLTYGQGNAMFDKMLYPRIFNEKPPILGKFITEAKIDFINLDITTWTPSAEQYTIFGDPATILAIPESSIDCKLNLSSVDASKQLELKSGYIRKLNIDPVTGENKLVIDESFNGQMIVSVVFPNNMDEDKTNDLNVKSEFVKVTKGKFDKVSINIPSGVIPGDGRLRCYANSGDAAAIGGVKFSVEKPVVEYVSSVFVDDDFMQVHAAIVDNLGKAGIRSVVCEWHNTETWKWHTNIMIPSAAPPDAPAVEGFWYSLREYIPLSKPGTAIEFKIIVTDTEENVVSSAFERVKIPIGVNLAISKEGANIQSNITYSYSQIDGAWILTAYIENNGGKEVKKPIVVYFFEGNPDVNKDDIFDPTAKVLGYCIIDYHHWQKGSHPIQTAKATIKLNNPLSSGLHQVFVWINPRIPASEDVLGLERVEDADPYDDIAYKVFQVNEFLVGKGDETTKAQSLDGSLSMVIQSGSVSETVMSITNIVPPKSKWEQADLTLGLVPEMEYGVSTDAFKIELASGLNSLKKEAQVDVRFDVTKLRELAKKTKGLVGKPESQLNAIEKEWIEIATQNEAKKLGVYMWQEDIGMWRYMRSELIINEDSGKFSQEPYVTIPSKDNSSEVQLGIDMITIDEIITPIGNWVIFFLNSERYKLYLRRESMDIYENLRFGEVEQTFSRPDLGIQINITKGNKSFKYGDVFKFDTFQDLNGAIKLQSLRSYVNGDGTAKLDIMSPDEFYEVSYVPGYWAVFFTGPKTYEIHNQYGEVVNDPFGYPFIGEVGKEMLIPNIGIKIAIYEGRWAFQFGDKFVFKTLYVGTVRAGTYDLGTITLIHSNDLIPPSIQLWVNKAIPQSGTVIPPNPSISLMLSDKNGIDVNSFSFMMSVNDREFYPVSKDDYVFPSRSGGVNSPTNVPVFYSPILYIGKYKYRISVMDLNGNRTRSNNGEDYLEFMFLVEKQPDVKPPVIVVTADGQVLFDGQIFKKSPELAITIEDDNALDVSTISFLFSKEGEALNPLEKHKYKMTIADNLSKVTMLYPSDLVNGEYIIQAIAKDTSGNLSELAPIKFRLDQQVEVKDILNYPNPFSNNTIFTYWLTQPAEKVVIKIYNLRGRLIKTIEQDMPRWKYNEEHWDGRDKEGNKLASGVYLYKLTVFDGNRKLEKVEKLAIVR